MDISPGPGWDRLIRILRVEQGIVILLGETDSGKTTLARCLVESLVESPLPVALIDSDVGQSGIGLPGTISIKVFRRDNDLADFGCERMTFLGFTNPAKVIPLMVAMTRHMTAIGRRRAGIGVVDTTGLISGEFGKALKIAKIRAIRPAHVVAVQRGNELEHILSLVRDARIHRLQVSPAAKKRSAAARRAYRKRKLQEYFKAWEQSKLILDIATVKLICRGLVFPVGEKEMSNGAIIGLNHDNNTLALGVVEGTDGPLVLLRTPLRSLRGINRVVYGDMTMS